MLPPLNGDWNAHDKDRLENTLHRKIRIEKSITLKQAQEEIASDWVAAYKKYVGERKPFKPRKVCNL